MLYLGMKSVCAFVCCVDIKCLLNETCTWCHEWDQDNRWLNGILSNSCNREFDFAKPEEWPRWSKRFEQFRQASDFASKTEEVQISTLVYSMGDKAEDLFQSFNLTEEAKKYSTVKAKFENHFVKCRNTIYERVKFNCQKQEDGETVDEFVTDLYRLAEHCGYGILHDELVRDRIVEGIKDSKLSEKLQMTPDLTLESAVIEARHSEAVKKQQSVVRGEMLRESTIEAAKTCRQPRGLKPRNKFTRPAPRPQGCTRCGQSQPHSRQQCPAKEVVCHKCRKKGRHKSCCKTRVSIREVNLGSDDEVFLGVVHGETAGTKTPWVMEYSSKTKHWSLKWTLEWM